MSDWLDELKKLDAAATLGPWQNEFDYIHSKETGETLCRGDDYGDMELIAKTRNALPKLIAIAEAAKAVTDNAMKERLPDTIKEHNYYVIFERYLVALHEALR